MKKLADRRLREVHGRGARERLGPSGQAHLRQHEDQRPLRHHPDRELPKSPGMRPTRNLRPRLRRFISVFYPAAEYNVTNGIPRLRVALSLRAVSLKALWLARRLPAEVRDLPPVT